MLTRLDNAKLKLLIFSFPSGNGKMSIFKMKVKVLEYQRNFEIEFFHIDESCELQKSLLLYHFKKEHIAI